MTTPEVDRALHIAQKIADRAPAKQGDCVFAALIPWTLIHELRGALLDLTTEQCHS